MPFAAAKVMAVFTTPPEARISLIYSLTWSSISSPTSKGLPHFFSGNSLTPATWPVKLTLVVTNSLR